MKSNIFFHAEHFTFIVLFHHNFFNRAVTHLDDVDTPVHRGLTQTVKVIHLDVIVEVSIDIYVFDARWFIHFNDILEFFPIVGILVGCLAAIWHIK